MNNDEESESETLGPEAFPMIVLMEAGLAPLALVLGSICGVHPLAGFEWTLRGAIFGVLATVPMLVFLLISLRWPHGPLRGIRDFCQRELAPVLAHRPWRRLALIACTAGVGEELLFRGVIQTMFTSFWGRGLGLLAASLLFGALHPVSLAYAVVAGCLGAYLGAIWLITGNLLSAIIAHILYDFAALFLLLRPRRAVVRGNCAERTQIRRAGRRERRLRQRTQIRQRAS